VQDTLNEKGLTLFSKNNLDGTVLVKKYIGILQRMSSEIQKLLIVQFAISKNVISDANYDWSNDPSNLKLFVKLNHGKDFYNYLTSSNIVPKLPMQLVDYVDRNIQRIAKLSGVAVNVDGNTRLWNILDNEVPRVKDQQTGLFRPLTAQEYLEYQAFNKRSRETTQQQLSANPTFKY
jgi:hypothetical protein